MLFPRISLLINEAHYPIAVLVVVLTYGLLFLLGFKNRFCF